jgi:S1-C subfamily serine protease
VKSGDVVKGRTASEADAAGNEIRQYKPGEKIGLTVKRDGKEHRRAGTVGQ